MAEPIPERQLSVEQSGESVCITHNHPDDDTTMADTWPLTTNEARYLKERLSEVVDDELG